MRQVGYRSLFEKQVISSLKKSKVPFTYEGTKIPYQKASNYIPDIKISDKLFIEIKGRFTAVDRQKHLLIQKQHPDIEIRFVFQRLNNKLSKSSKTSYAQWCEKYGFKYAESEVPHTWIQEFNAAN